MLLTDAHYKNKIYKKKTKKQAQVVVRNIILPIVPRIILDLSYEFHQICPYVFPVVLLSNTQSDKQTKQSTTPLITKFPLVEVNSDLTQ